MLLTVGRRSCHLNVEMLNQMFRKSSVGCTLNVRQETEAENIECAIEVGSKYAPGSARWLNKQ